MIHPSAIATFKLQSAILRQPLTISPDRSVLDAVTLMNEVTQLEHHTFETASSCVLIVENHKLVGILTDRDVINSIAKSTPLADLPISAVMTQPVITLGDRAFTDLSVAIDILCQNHIRHLPLVDSDERLVGLLTRESLQQKSHPNELWREQVFKLEQELTESRSARERSAQQQQELVMRNQELTRSTQLKDEFLANMSHELRTPLNAILGMTEGLQEGIFGTPSPSQVQAIKTIENSGNHLLALIDDILDLAKIGAGQIELECTPTNICDLCNSSLAFVKQQALQKRIRLQVSFPPRVPNISIDERRMRQVLINLLSNAVKFTPVGGHIALDVTIEADNTTNSYLRFAVIDTGIGISSANVDRLFQPFVQVDAALNRQHNGTGLGLALVKGIVEMHGGSTQVRSEVGVGSQFIVDLPIPPSECTVTGDPLPHALGFSQPVPQLPDGISDDGGTGQWKILLVEDNPANSNSIASYLKAKGYQTILATNGLEAISLAQSQRPNLILMDIQMPKMDGLEAIEYIRNQSQLKEVPIIALTALAMSGDREKCLAAGANEYLTKPVKLKQLAVTIQQFLVAEVVN